MLEKEEEKSMLIPKSSFSDGRYQSLDSVR